MQAPVADNRYIHFCLRAHYFVCTSIYENEKKENSKCLFLNHTGDMWYYGNAKITCNEKGEDIYMTKKEFQQFIAKGKMILDGATGSNLQKRGMPTGVCPEEWILEHPEVLVAP